jgi:serine/threonine protein kinase
LSPQNILLDREGAVRLLDFGLANCAGDSLRLTPEFSAPERLLGRPVSAATDLYSLGRVLEFLRARPAEHSTYLDLEPSQRRFTDLQSGPEGRRRLADKVNSYLHRMKINQNVKTRTHSVSPGRRSPKAGMLAGLLLLISLAAAGASRKLEPARLAVLNLRTHRWHYFKVDGAPIGYAPLSVPLSAGERHRLEWVSASGRGGRDLVLTAHEARTLEDRDFSH